MEMLTLIKNKKRGFGLVEVMVALSILAMVFSAVVTLIVNVVNLNLVSRQRTEAIAFAQDGLALGVAEISNGCPSKLPTNINIDPWNKIYPDENGKYYRTISFTKGNLVNDSTDGSIKFEEYTATGNDYNYFKVTSKVQWHERENFGTLPVAQNNNVNGAQVYSVSQIVKVSND